MNKRKRKKWLKQHKKYINPCECYELDYTLAKFILPRLKILKRDTNGYPGNKEVDTFEKWIETLDKMILAFEYIIEEDKWWMGNPKYDYTSGMHIRSEECDGGRYKKIVIDKDDWVDNVEKAHYEEAKRRQSKIEEGLCLFGKYFQHLWW